MSHYDLYDYTFRIIIIGDCFVGKTSIVNRIISNHYQHHYDSTIGIDYGAVCITLNDGMTVKCQLWDTAGQEVFAPLIKSYYRDITAAIMVYDVTSEKSFKKIKFWLNEIDNHRNNDYPIPKLLIGNKIDSENRVVSYNDAKQFCDKHGLIYSETSARTSTNIRETFELLCNTIIENKAVNAGIIENKRAIVLKNESKKDRSYYNCGSCQIS